MADGLKVPRAVPVPTDGREEFQVEIVEHVQWIYRVRAKTPDEAIEMVLTGELEPSVRNPSQDSPTVSRLGEPKFKRGSTDE
jgi:hypothetical protein